MQIKPFAIKIFFPLLSLICADVAASSSFLRRRRFITAHQESIIHARGAPKAIQLECVCGARASVSGKGACTRVCACVLRAGGGVGLLCENNIGFFRQNELYYCTQP